jgi:hypothetical protein
MNTLVSPRVRIGVRDVPTPSWWGIFFVFLGIGSVDMIFTHCRVCRCCVDASGFWCMLFVRPLLNKLNKDGRMHLFDAEVDPPFRKTLYYPQANIYWWTKNYSPIKNCFSYFISAWSLKGNFVLRINIFHSCFSSSCHTKLMWNNLWNEWHWLLKKVMITMYRQCNHTNLTRCIYWVTGLCLLF